jgi:hypothetical protein
MAVENATESFNFQYELYRYCLRIKYGLITINYNWRTIFSTPVRRIGEAEIKLHSFYTSELDGGQWLFSDTYTHDV